MHSYGQGLLKKDIELSLEKFDELKECVYYLETHGVRIQLSHTIANSIVAYSRALPENSQRKFFYWLLNDPLDTPPQIERMSMFLFTGAILKNNSEWFTDDPIVRLNLFAEAITVSGTRLGYW